MSTSIPLQISRLADLDRHTQRLLRNFSMEWRCGAQLILTMLKHGLPAEVIRTPLVSSLALYQQMCRDGVSDFQRLYAVLAALLGALREHQIDLSEAQLNEWCAKSNVPAQVTESLIHG